MAGLLVSPEMFAIAELLALARHSAGGTLLPLESALQVLRARVGSAASSAAVSREPSSSSPATAGHAGSGWEGSGPAGSAQPTGGPGGAGVDSAVEGEATAVVISSLTSATIGVPVLAGGTGTDAEAVAIAGGGSEGSDDMGTEAGSGTESDEDDDSAGGGGGGLLGRAGRMFGRGGVVSAEVAAAMRAAEDALAGFGGGAGEDGGEDDEAEVDAIIASALRGE
ncbi:hypothetical protein T492DRAFT_926309 [Pavlovales sp. CCMP2436]|nr:hypothetical protein T492DRAFT_926309 [Pavlovales sp. CCMP2436]